MILGGLIVIFVGAVVVGIGLWRSTPSDSWVGQLQSQLQETQKQLADLKAAQKTTQTIGIGAPPDPNATTIQWNQIFGTSRAVDLVFALFLDGVGPESRSVKLKDAFLESGITGEVIKMKVAGSDNPLENPFPVSEANPIPPKGFIRLVATMNQSSPNLGLANRVFLENWRRTWFNAVYEDGKIDRILFDEAVMESYFPGLAGPHVTRKSDGKKE
jgi:hypothetical protein